MLEGRELNESAWLEGTVRRRTSVPDNEPLLTLPPQVFFFPSALGRIAVCTRVKVQPNVQIIPPRHELARGLRRSATAMSTWD